MSNQTAIADTINALTKEHRRLTDAIEQITTRINREKRSADTLNHAIELGMTLNNYLAKLSFVKECITEIKPAVDNVNHLNHCFKQ